MRNRAELQFVASELGDIAFRSKSWETGTRDVEVKVSQSVRVPPETVKLDDPHFNRMIPWFFCRLKYCAEQNRVKLRIDREFRRRRREQ